MSGVFLTGGSGFIGGRLIERLRRDGYAVAPIKTVTEGLAQLRAG